MAPGIQEDREGRPFVGSSGNLLRHLLKETGFPKDVAFANAVSCFPGRIPGGDAKPTTSQLEACRRHLTAQIDVIQPRYIFLVGGTALEAFRPDVSLSNLHGRPMFYDGHDLGHKLSYVPFGIVAWTIYHPAAAIRQKKFEMLIRDDLRTFWEWRRVGEPWPDTCYVCLREFEEFDRWGVPWCKLHAMRQGMLPLG